MCYHKSCIVKRAHIVECAICGRKINHFAVTDFEGYTTILDTYPICEECINELVYEGVNLEELV
jgi:hypothetical protein